MGRLEELILGDSRRGIDRLMDLLPGDFCAQTGRFVGAWPRGRVLLVTGFYVDGRGETDGPPGTKLLFDALRKLGFSPLVVTDSFCAAYCTAAEVPFVTFGPEAGEEELRALLDRERPVGLIAVERSGLSPDESRQAAAAVRPWSRDAWADRIVKIVADVSSGGGASG